MRTQFSLAQSCTAAILVIFSLYASGISSAADVASWPQWRGPEQNGFAPGDSFPTVWSETNGTKWRLELPGRGGSTPVVAGGKAFLTAGADEKNHLLAVDVKTGKLDWQVELGGDAGGKHQKGSGANPSPVTDGESVYAYFRSGDLACVSLAGEIQWQINLQKEFGEDSLWWDLGTSPLLTDNAVVVAVMQTGPSYLVAFEKTTGKQLWKTERKVLAPEESAQSYTTPVNVTINGLPGIAVMGADHLTLNDAKSGKELARLGGFNPEERTRERSISSPVAHNGIVVCPYQRGQSLTAVRISELANGKGKAAIAWFRDDLGSDVPTPAAHDGRVYVVSDDKQMRGLVACLDNETGKTIWEVQIPKSRKSFSSSPLVAGDHLYVTGEDAAVYVIGPLSSAQPTVVATNVVTDSDPTTVSSPVPAGDNLLLRTRNRLYCFGK
ncbi:outer membrane protein assembly factor BamB family protein [Stieleria varia]|uniref:Outer membrane biogenesis protein BamB n=1 Tax=Stieleria varia TaxID=2528005 RepID=A0A5C6A1U2_9BACT|nr:PQQ-binding-like beta-propeller repeat protein [Stieleria varia]TWT93822.1 outer membrane biogenesis protein BamB [Stieleria varia]